MLTALVLFLPFELYLRWPSCFWNFDGVACAAALELGDPSFFFHSNHLLYAFIGFHFWKWILFPLGLTRALPALQLYTSLLSVIGLLGVYHALRRVTGEPLFAVFVTWTLSVAAVVWVWSIEAQVYPLGFIGLAWGTTLLLRPLSPAKYRWVGIMHGLAVLGHLMNVLWCLPVWFWIQKEADLSPRERQERRLQHGLWFLGVTVAAYALVIFSVLLPRHPTPWLITWLKGSAGLTADRRWQWHGGGYRSPLIWGWSTLCFFWGSLWPYALGPLRWSLWGLTAISAGTLGFLIQRSWRLRRNPAWLFAVLWIASYGLFLWTWEPGTLCYRMTECVPFGLLVALGLSTVADPKQRFAVIALAFLSTGTLNFFTLIRPMHDSRRNALYVETLALSQATPPDALYFSNGGTPWIYLLYFTGRSAWSVKSPAGENAFRLNKNKPVFVEEPIIRGPDMPAWLQGHQWTPLKDGIPWMKMQ